MLSEITGKTLTTAQQNVFNQQWLTAVVATVSSDGFPNAAPMALFYAPDESKVRMSVGTMHETYTNIKENGKVSICVMEEGDYAFTVKGYGKVLREKSETTGSMSIIEVDVEEVKEDTSPVAEIIQAIRLNPRSDKSQRFLEKIAQELKSIE